MKTGLHALVDLDRAPLAAGDVRALGLSVETCWPDVDHIRAMARDAEALGAGGSAHREGDRCWFLGELDDAEGASAALGCESLPAAVALAAVRAWGPRTSDRLEGQWSLLFWDARAHALWLGTSRLGRDRVYFAFDGRRVGVSSDLARLAGLSWIDATLDREGVAYALSSGEVRRRGAGRTAIKGIYELEAGTFHRFSARDAHDIHPPPPDVFPPWRGSFDEAVAALDRKFGETMRAVLRRHDRVALFMSGGLDSALIARFAAEARRPGQQILALTAVAPPGSARRDERELATDIAEAFGLEHRLIWPDDAARLFRPSPAHHADGELSLSPRHYLYDALFGAARAFGASVVLDGAGGEASVTRREETDGVAARARAVLRRARAGYRQRRDGIAGRADSYHVRLSPALLAALPADFAVTQGEHRLPSWPRRARDPMGWPPGHRKQWGHPTAVAGGGIRLLRPLRDPRLVALVAAMPAGFTWRDGQDRALARAMLKGHVPERVYRQPKGLAFSVDYRDRFDAEIAGILDRLPAWREADVDAWLDLDWLEGEVHRMTKVGSESNDERFRVQMTAIAAEYFVAWRQRERRRTSSVA